MYKETEYRERCAARGLSAEAIEEAVIAVRKLEAEVRGPDGTLATASLADIEGHISGLVSRSENSEARLMAIARYFAVLGIHAIATRLLAYLLPIGVLPDMAHRLGELEGAETSRRVMAGVRTPPAGSPPEEYPKATAAFLKALEKEIGADRARRVLTWNVHGIPASSFAAERDFFRASSSVDKWLSGFHARKVQEIAKHAQDGTLWFEQRITPRVVEYVRNNPEILGGVVEDDFIYATKIPYDPDGFLQSRDPLERRRLACHCPLAASAITASGSGVPPLWCSCSAGYEKFLFDTVFDEETEVEVLESVLAGDPQCRFRIKIPESVRERFR